MRQGALPIAGNQQVEPVTVNGKASYFIVPLLTIIFMVPLGLWVTGNGNITAGSGSTAVFWAVMAGTFISLVYFVGGRVL
ncbi:hypothetical protein NSU26_24345, partial [Salmonella enterica]|nr:hypothetical protein [Salmonella enterica]